MTIFFDLDGPIFDVSEKYFRVYSDLLISMNFVPMDKKRYWDLKRSMIPETEILRRTGAEVIQDWYVPERHSLIESDDYMKYDVFQPKAKEVLETLSSKNTLYLVTLRNSPAQLKKELELFDIKKYFKEVLSTGEEKEPRWRLKYDLVIKFLKGKLPQESFFIGDTATDIRAGNELGCKTIAVTNGIRNRKILESAKPDYIINNIKLIFELI